ncbi:hypothetical protein CA13_34890 [Planctomycetes bacterium CA13]|uniref:Uncharacterized protein n=1 Tax=Novipirellula herctigrandis TaxID=2527986 RepID=A0A5C5Z402_9BACT|nr:hypothetical protein CA13_34890 [Planctomycetes bacterium CA13]
MKDTNNHRYTSSCLCTLIVTIVLTAGCQFVPDRVKWSPDFFNKEEEAVVPTRMMVIWTDTVLHQPQKPGVRGFGGRIYFYNENDPDPVKVDGGLAVYAFDADDLNPTTAKPERKFVFTADQFAEYMSRTSMGVSYSVWCPWDEVGGYNEQLSLIVRFEGRGGGVVISDPTIKLLPGLNRPASVMEKSNNTNSGVTQAVVSSDTKSSNQMVSFETDPTRTVKAKAPRRKTETIDLPPSFYRHLRGPSVLDQPFEMTNENADATNELSTQPIVDELQIPDVELQQQQSVSSDRESNARWAQYPSRTLGFPRRFEPHGTRQEPIPAGWIEELPRTPRSGYPHSRSIAEETP